jgi:hypothetical protein
MTPTGMYERPRIERRHDLQSPLVGILVSGPPVVSAVFRSATYEAPRIESREPLEGALQTLSSNPVL